MFYFLTEVWGQNVSRSDIIQYNYEELRNALVEITKNVLGINKGKEEEVKESTKNIGTQPT